jgi:EAL domain-containing protein (putative c-di-GMP-specific phosphodiesterase class I)
MLLDDAPETRVVLQELNHLGIQLSIDDFGTGYSALSYLKRYPFDTLKIDRSFVQDVTVDPGDAALSTAIISMAHSMELKVVAEGVETREQLEFFRERAVDMVQGYLFSRPLKEDAFLQFIAEQREEGAVSDDRDGENGDVLGDRGGYGP